MAEESLIIVRSFVRGNKIRLELCYQGRTIAKKRPLHILLPVRELRLARFRVNQNCYQIQFPIQQTC